MPDKPHEINPEVRHYTPPRADAPTDRQEIDRLERDVRITVENDVKHKKPGI